MRAPRRFPRDIAERRLNEIIELAIYSGKNIMWMGEDDFVVIDWARHARFKAIRRGDDYVLLTFSPP